MRRFSTIAHLPRTAVLGAALAVGVSVAAMAPSADAAGKKEKKAAGEKKAGKKDKEGGDKKAEAREAYTSGEAAYKAGDYKTAYEGFKKANSFIPSIVAEFWMNMALSYLDDVPAGISGLESILMSTEAEKLGEEKLNMADARLKALKTTPATVKVTSDPPGATVSIAGKDQPGVTPMSVSVPPGATKITVSLKGYAPQNLDVTAKPAQTLEQTAKLEKAKEEPLKPIPAAAPPKAEDKKPAGPVVSPAEAGEKDNLPAYIALGAAVVGAGVGTFFGIKALGAKSDFNDHPTNSGADKVERNALIADMSFGIALALGITGGVLLFTGGGDSSEVSAKHRFDKLPRQARFDIAPVLTPHTQGAAARFTF